ncbi:MAG: DUF2922 domain-containing protein [Syntrophomonadaceae bacterium]|nr:DUF2922 domain-containing protein [Syntrophomonadaceae bacterium]
MARVLEMRFANASGSTVNVRVSEVKDPYTGAEASALMDHILARNIFSSSGGDYVAKESARIITTETTDLDLI